MENLYTITLIMTIVLNITAWFRITYWVLRTLKAEAALSSIKTETLQEPTKLHPSADLLGMIDYALAGRLAEMKKEGK